MTLKGAVFLSAEQADGSAALLSRLSADKAVARLTADQPYAASQPGWQAFLQRTVQAGVYELRRGKYPRASVDALLPLLA
jgi:hypothetical protein